MRTRSKKRKKQKTNHLAARKFQNFARKRPYNQKTPFYPLPNIPPSKDFSFYARFRSKSYLYDENDNKCRFCAIPPLFAFLSMFHVSQCFTDFLFHIFLFIGDCRQLCRLVGKHTKEHFTLLCLKSRPNRPKSRPNCWASVYYINICACQGHYHFDNDLSRFPLTIRPLSI